KQVVIHKLVDGVFYASLICENNNIEEIIDARTSDAIALALRFSAPIFTYKNILDKAGVILKIDNVKEGKKIEDSLVFESEPSKGNKMKVPADETFKDLSLSDLKDLLKKAVQGEDYEVAAKLRDEISKR
ncbi:MAG: bifunctional nuclease family protein, partial [Bacteroidota bacterium]|nr:bifunctional nuclease family protein [Bacteroidota bacterium]